MSRIQVEVPKKSKQILLDHKDEYGFERQDEAMEDILNKFEVYKKDDQYHESDY